MIHSAKLSHIWRDTMHEFGYAYYCESTSEMNNIGYSYTQDAPLIVIQRGEALWKILFNILGDDAGQTHISQWDIQTVTRRHELWDK